MLNDILLHNCLFRLTAYVLKCFSQADELISIDEEVLSKAMEWLVKKQNSDGSFNEKKPVYYVDVRKISISSHTTKHFLIILRIPMRSFFHSDDYKLF
jgi:hypothetical protein